MRKRTFNEMIEYFIDRVAKMEIEDKYKLELVGMVSAIQTEHEMQKHGKWINGSGIVNGHTYPFPECSICGKLSTVLYKPDYCPNCGADMRGDNDA